MRHLGGVLLALLLVAGCAGDPEPAAAPPSVAPPSVAPPSVAPPSVAPPSPTSPTPRPSLAAPAGDLPRAVAAVGDSITVAVNPDRMTFGADLRRSWVTGDDPADVVLSHVERLRAAGAPVREVHNVAEAGAMVADGPRQARAAVAALAGDPGYVTVALGANDACRGRAITPLEEFRAAAVETLQVLSAARPYILVMSIPDATRLWPLARGQQNARAIWDQFEICRGVLPTGATEESRAAVRAQTVAYNEIWRSACSSTPRCRYDGGAVFERVYSLAEVSELDFFHPSTQGQAQLAETTWRAGWWPGR